MQNSPPLKKITTLDLLLTYFIIFDIDISILAKVNVHFRSHAFIDMHTRMEHYKIEPKLIQDRRGDTNGIILLLLIFSVNLLGMKEKGFLFNCESGWYSHP